MDTGASCSVIRRGVLGDIKVKRDGRELVYLIAAVGYRVEVTEEILLTVRFQESVVDLPCVRVIDQCAFELIFVADWIEKSRAVIFGEDGQLQVRLDRSSFPERVQHPAPSSTSSARC